MTGKRTWSKGEIVEPALQLIGVSRSLGRRAILQDITLEIGRGEIISLVGHSGCGKSTLLRIIAGVETIDTGQVLIEGQLVDGANFVEPEARAVGFVFQDYALFPHLSVRDNILFGLKRSPRQQAAEAAADIMRRIGIEHLADRFPHTLSGGEQQRVALARALAPRPGIILMDEPFSNLDQGLRGQVRANTLSLLRSLNATVILVTHDPQEALSAGDRVVLMRGGRIVQAGTPYDLHDNPANPYAAEFFCAYNKVSGSYRDGTIETVLGAFPWSGPVRPDSQPTLYIRPQAITLSRDDGEFTARISSRSFHGETEQFELNVDGLESSLRAVTRERFPAEIDVVKVSISPEGVLVF